MYHVITSQHSTFFLSFFFKIVFLWNPASVIISLLLPTPGICFIHIQIIKTVMCMVGLKLEVNIPSHYTKDRGRIFFTLSKMPCGELPK